MTIKISSLIKIFSFVILNMCVLYALLISRTALQTLLIIPPLIYLMGYIWFNKIFNFIQYPGMFLFNVISFIRYYLIPVLMIFESSTYTTDVYLYKGVGLLIYECVVIFILLNVIIKKKYKKITNEKIEKDPNNEHLMIKLVIGIAILLLIMQPSILDQYNFVFNEVENIVFIKQSELVTGINSIIFNVAKLFFPVILIIYFYKIKNRNMLYILSIIILLVLNVSFFSGTSRNSVVIPAIASMFFLLKLFQDKRKITWFLFMTTILTVTIQLTVTKSQYLNSNSFSNLSGIINYLDVYFSGPNNLGISIKAKELYSDTFTFRTFINDLFSNAPILSNYTDQNDRTSKLFNLSFYNGGQSTDQIIPSIGQGLFYFGYLFSVVPQMVVIFLIALLDKHYAKTTNIILMYFLAYFAARFGFGYTQNISILINFSLAVILPVISLVFVNRLINNKINLFKLNARR